MTTKVTFDSIKKLIEERNSKLLTEKENFKNGSSILELECKCGNKFNQTYYNLSRRTGEFVCNNCKKPSKDRIGIKNIEELVKKFDCIVLSKEEDYKNDTTEINLKCKCGNEFKSNYKNLRRKKYISCKNCDNENNCLRTPYEQVKNYIEEYNCLLISKTFKNFNEDLEIKCKCGINYKTSFDCYKRSVYKCCINCSDKLRIKNVIKANKEKTFSYTEIKNFIEQQNCKLLSDNTNYINRDTILDIQCKCGLLFKNNINKLRNYKYILCKECRKQEIKNTILDLYGVDNIMKLEEYFQKRENSSKRKKIYKFPSGKEIKLQGYENLAIDDLLKIYKEEEIEVSTCGKVPKIPYEFQKEDKIYYPDIFIPKENKIIEVKSCYTFLYDVDKNLTKNLIKTNIEVFLLTPLIVSTRIFPIFNI